MTIPHANHRFSRKNGRLPHADVIEFPPSEIGDEGKVELISGSLSDVLAALHGKGYDQLYIDGGATVQSFLDEDLIDEMIITLVPILLGGGSPLFGKLRQPMDFDLVNTEVLLNAMVKNHYRRKR